jgi:hypothetical protein
VVTIDLAAELKQGRRVLDLPSVFPGNPAAEMFARTQQGKRERPPL